MRAATFRHVLVYVCCWHAWLTGRFLAGIGEIVYYADDEALKDVVVLDPQWLTMDILGSLVAPDVENLRSLFKAH